LPPVRRVTTTVPEGDDAATPATREVSALRCGTDPVAVVLVHGGAQNAHTWDTVALCLGRSTLAIDLPGHGHSGWRSDGAYSPMNLADDVAVAIAQHAPTARVVVGMSLGGMTAMELAVRHRALVRSLVMVDVTPGVNAAKAKAVIDFVDGPQSFASFDELLARTKEFNPTRSESSLRRGILHNAHQLTDGSWQWRYDRGSHARS
jgi:pimeloyl-ACP methyl ester carboxylesterase